MKIKKIIRTHNLLELCEVLKDKISFSDDEIKEVLDFAEMLFDKVCKILEIDKTEVQI